MTRQLASLILGSGVLALAAACATKGYVQEQLSATETKLTQRFDIQETKLRETSDRAGASRQAIDAASQRLQGLDARVGEVDALATGAKTRADLATTRADLAAVVAHDTEARLSQRVADRNKYRLLETRFLYFDSDQANVRKEGVTELDGVAKALKADPNALVELQGFSDPRGSDQYNYQLARERVEAVIRYLVQSQSIELRQIRAVALGKVPLAAGEKASPEIFAKARRVDVRLLAPWSSWEDAQAAALPTRVVLPAQAQLASPAEAASPVRPTEAASAGRPAQGGAERPTGIVLEPPVTSAAASGWPEFLKSISPADFGGKE